MVPLLACPVCSSSKRKTLFQIPSSEVKECQDCGLKYLDPCLSPHAMKQAYESEKSLMEFNAHHEGYYGYGDVEKPSQTLTEFNRELDLLEKLRPASVERSILDVGFGNGFFLAVARKRGWQVDGVDTSSHNVELARKKFGLELSHGALEELSVGKRFDAISFLDVIEHLPNPHLALQNALRHLKPNGFILIAVPNDDSFFGWLSGAFYNATGGKLSSGVRKLYLLEHVSYYSRKTLSKLAELNGLMLRGSFLSNTDLKKYSLPPIEHLAGTIILTLSTLLGKQNRLIGVFQKKS